MFIFLNRKEHKNKDNDSTTLETTQKCINKSEQRISISEKRDYRTGNEYKLNIHNAENTN